MKIKLFLFLIIFLNSSFANDYIRQCKSDFKDMELMQCLVKLKEKSQILLDARVDQVLDETGEYTKLKRSDFYKANDLFKEFLVQQCAILFIFPQSVADKYTVKDCEIKMIHDRIKQFDYVFYGL